MSATNIPTVEQIAARLLDEHKVKHPPVYPVERDDVFVPFGWGLHPEPYPSWKEPQA